MRGFRVLLLAAVTCLCCARPEPADTAAREHPRLHPWSELVGERLAASAVSPRQDAGGVVATISRWNLQARFGPGGVAITPLSGARVWEVQVGAVGWGHDGGPVLRELSAPRLGACAQPVAVEVGGDCARRVERVSASGSEWWQTGESGIEHGFDLLDLPGEASPASIRIAVAVVGAAVRVDPDGAGATLLQPHGPPLRYDTLLAWDAVGSRLPSVMVPGRDGIDLVIDTSTATFPVVVDPLLSVGSWSWEADQEQAHAGASVAAAGDVNCDGFGDVVVGVPGWSGGEVAEGAVFLFPGGPTGPSPTSTWSAESDQVGAGLGSSVGTAGDATGDGCWDLVVGSPAWDHDSLTNAGRVWFFAGDPAGPGAVTQIVESFQADSGFGTAVGPAGDINGDGLGDVVVGQPGWDAGQVDEGRAAVYLGTTTGMATVPAWSMEGDRDGAALGSSAAGVGDVSGDGFTDVAAGAPMWSNGQSGEGRVALALGIPGGLSAVPSWTWEPNQGGAGFGRSIAAAGDVDGDGYADILVGSPGWDGGAPDSGRVWLFAGSSAGPATGAASWAWDPGQTGAGLGSAIGGAGDLDGDGRADIVVGSASWDGVAEGSGAAWVFLGRDVGLPAAPDWTLGGTSPGEAYGGAVGAAGDTDGNGLGEILVGAPGWSGPQPGEGRVVWLGSTIRAPAESPDWQATGTSDGEQMGSALGWAGDLDGDGYGDFVIGEPDWSGNLNQGGRVLVYLGGPAGPATTPDVEIGGWVEGGRFGAAAAGVGDTDGDGFGDLVVGAPCDGDPVGVGYAALFAGGPGGPSGTASWSALGDASGWRFGAAIAGAGDLQGDGFGDVAVGAPGGSVAAPNEGLVRVYHGGPLGPSISPSLQLAGGQDGAAFGTSVAGLGDVDGDGLDDLAVGTPEFDGADADCGGVWFYSGSPTGLSGVPTWTIQGDGPGAGLGTVAGAGDTDGDGFADLLVAAPGYGGAGRVWVFPGGPSGPASSSAWSLAGLPGSGLGTGVACGGDPNGDGFADVLLGAPFWDDGSGPSGRVLLMLGGVGGLSSEPSFAADGSEVGAQLGATVAQGGDIDGDGYSDILAGSPGLSVGAPLGGGAMWWPGRGEGPAGSALPRYVTPLRSGTPIPIAPGSGTVVPGQFDIAAFARTSFGRGRVRLQVEIEPRGVPFLGSGPFLESDYLDTGSQGAELVLPIVDLAAEMTWHFRARLQPDPSQGFPLIASPWVYGGVPGHAEGTHVRTPCDDTEGDGICDSVDPDDDDDGAIDSSDCDPSDPAIHPGAVEACDAVDSNCDGSLVDDFLDWNADGVPECGSVDSDGDGTGDLQDCGPGDSSIHPGATELCDSVDSDCDGSLDDDFPDLDGDGQPDCIDPDDDGDGDPDENDCGPLDPEFHAGATELCDAFDSNCDGDLVDGTIDSDGDGAPDCIDPVADPGDDDTTPQDDGDSCSGCALVSNPAPPVIASLIGLCWGRRRRAAKVPRP